jgi:hypothetical protein
MQSGKFLLLLILFSLGGTHHYPLPKSAVITIRPMQRDHTYQDHQADLACDRYHLTEARVRFQFRTYHELAEGEAHANYLIYPCWINGTIVVDGKTYTWSSQLGNTMETTWPDGVKKTLGGKPTDDPSGK